MWEESHIFNPIGYALLQLVAGGLEKVVRETK
jgi:hypothetical protein